MDARFDFGECGPDLLKLLNQPDALFGRLWCPPRGLQSGSEAFPLGNQGPAGRSIAAKTLHRSTDLKRPNVQIDICPLQPEHFAEPKAASQTDCNEGLQRVPTTGNEQCLRASGVSERISRLAVRGALN